MPNGSEPADMVGLPEEARPPQQPFLAAVLACAGALALAWHERARQRRHLMQLDDRALADIGIRRAAAEREGRNPFWRPLRPAAIDFEKLDHTRRL